MSEPLTVETILSALRCDRETPLSKAMMADILGKSSLMPVSIARIKIILRCAGEFLAAQPQPPPASQLPRLDSNLVETASVGDRLVSVKAPARRRSNGPRFGP